ncbi:MAG: hypothetical protein J6333_00245, partial [Planctomycetes bacterium]|nr:hypothetical protein [Planctomycetota bacterium]
MATQPRTKTFTGRNVAEAILLARKEYGPDAVVVDKREVKAKKSLFTLKAEPMVEIVAAPPDFLPPKPAAAPAKNGGTLVERTYGQATIPTGGQPAAVAVPPGVSVDITHGRSPAPAAPAGAPAP